MTKAIIDKVEDGVGEAIIRKQIPRYVSRHISKLGEKTFRLKKESPHCVDFSSDRDIDPPIKA